MWSMWVNMIQNRVVLCQSKKRKGKFVSERVILYQNINFKKNSDFAIENASILIV
jgi:hypothetical protein